jgi:hypothetical protein
MLLKNKTKKYKNINNFIVKNNKKPIYKQKYQVGGNKELKTKLNNFINQRIEGNILRIYENDIKMIILFFLINYNKLYNLEKTPEEKKIQAILGFINLLYQNETKNLDRFFLIYIKTILNLNKDIKLEFLKDENPTYNFINYLHNNADRSGLFDQEIQMPFIINNMYIEDIIQILSPINSTEIESKLDNKKILATSNLGNTRYNNNKILALSLKTAAEEEEARRKAKQDENNALAQSLINESRRIKEIEIEEQQKPTTRRRRQLPPTPTKKNSQNKNSTTINIQAEERRKAEAEERRKAEEARKKAEEEARRKEQEKSNRTFAESLYQKDRRLAEEHRKAQEHSNRIMAERLEEEARLAGRKANTTKKQTKTNTIRSNNNIDLAKIMENHQQLLASPDLNSAIKTKINNVNTMLDDQNKKSQLCRMLILNSQEFFNKLYRIKDRYIENASNIKWTDNLCYHDSLIQLLKNIQPLKQYIDIIKIINLDAKDQNYINFKQHIVDSFNHKNETDKKIIITEFNAYFSRKINNKTPNFAENFAKYIVDFLLLFKNEFNRDGTTTEQTALFLKQCKMVLGRQNDPAEILPKIIAILKILSIIVDKSFLYNPSQLLSTFTFNPTNIFYNNLLYNNSTPVIYYEEEQTQLPENILQLRFSEKYEYNTINDVIDYNFNSISYIKDKEVTLGTKTEKINSFQKYNIYMNLDNFEYLLIQLIIYDYDYVNGNGNIIKGIKIKNYNALICINNTLFELISIVAHTGKHGDSVNSGHYVNYSKQYTKLDIAKSGVAAAAAATAQAAQEARVNNGSGSNVQWIEFDDEHTNRPINPRPKGNIIGKDINAEQIRNTPYLLLLKKVPNDINS